MYTNIIEFLAFVLFIGSLWHAMRYQGRAWAQQWFVTAAMFAVIRETIVQVVLQTYIFEARILRLGIVPIVMILLYPSVLYLAFHFAQRLTVRPAWIAGIMFAVAASFGLAIEATAALTEWWVYTGAPRVMFGGVPLGVPFSWGGAAAIFYAIFYRIRGAHLPDQGKLYALVTLSPAIAAVHLLWGLILGML